MLCFRYGRLTTETKKILKTYFLYEQKFISLEQGLQVSNSSALMKSFRHPGWQLLCHLQHDTYKIILESSLKWSTSFTIKVEKKRSQECAWRKEIEMLWVQGGVLNGEYGGVRETCGEHFKPSMKWYREAKLWKDWKWSIIYRHKETSLHPIKDWAFLISWR